MQQTHVNEISTHAEVFHVNKTRKKGHIKGFLCKPLLAAQKCNQF